MARNASVRTTTEDNAIPPEKTFQTFQTLTLGPSALF